MHFFIGVKIIRIFFVVFQLINLFQSYVSKEDNFDQIKKYMDGRLDTIRIKRIFKEIAEEAKFI